MPERLLGQFGRFALAGALGLGLDLAVLYGALALGADWVLGRLSSFLVAATFTWAVNRRYAFAATASPLREWASYLAGMAGGMLLNFVVYALTLALLPPAWWAPGLAAACGSAAGLGVNFASAKLLVFKS